MRHDKSAFCQSIHPLVNWPKGKCRPGVWEMKTRNGHEGVPEDFHDYLQDTFKVDPCRYSTWPGLGAALYRWRFVYQDITQRNVRVRRLAMETKRGARVQVLRPGTYDKLRVYDLPLCYSHVALDLTLPKDSTEYHRFTLVDTIGAAYVSWELLPNVLPPVPIMCPRTRYLPLGHCLPATLPDVKCLQLLGGNPQLHEGWSATGTDHSLRDFAAWVIDTSHCVPSWKPYLKAMFNGTVGKLGQSNLQELYWSDNCVKAIRTLHGPIWMPEHYNAIVSTARAKVSLAANQVLPVAVYIATDSIAVRPDSTFEHVLESQGFEYRETVENLTIPQGRRCSNV